MEVRKIPSSGEEIPVIGLGTWQAFDADASQSARAPLREVLRLFFHAGGKVIDSSPMYGRAESVIGDLVTEGNHRGFLATKVWTRGEAAGKQQIAQSMSRMKTSCLDLLQIHNLVDWRTQLTTMRALHREGKIRYLGITHYSLSSFSELESIMRNEKLDFIQLPYSLAVREAEKRLLPAAQETGTAVLVMRPFEEGALLNKIRGTLPDWASEFQSWPQLLLRFILEHPAVTCVIPATSKPEHMKQILQASDGPSLSPESKKKLLSLL